MNGGRIESASLSRVWQHHETKYCGTISAFRGFRRKAYQIFKKELKAGKRLWEIREAKPLAINKTENMQRHRLLLQELYRSGFGFVTMDGVYEEAGTGKRNSEKSFFVWSSKDFKDKLLQLGVLFEQDSITYAPPGEDFVLLSTSPKDINANNAKIGEVLMKFQGSRWGTKFQDKGKKVLQQMYSEIKGRHFYWKSINDPEIKAASILKRARVYPSEVYAIKAKINKPIPEKYITTDSCFFSDMINGRCNDITDYQKWFIEDCIK